MQREPKQVPLLPPEGSGYIGMGIVKAHTHKHACHCVSWGWSLPHAYIAWEMPANNVSREYGRGIEQHVREGAGSIEARGQAAEPHNTPRVAEHIHSLPLPSTVCHLAEHRKALHLGVVVLQQAGE